ncbi:hypothetical protein EVAR_99517_1 [Eumeta japonica]|uniref:Uncharacterized protein n=1 Tax=Eumeta variegata TaxID=151549 RepID=A0A4C1SFI0_EUMVA|nr:hypothetical protein EVAR_99517_1 [Eumeta japonica]
MLRPRLAAQFSSVNPECVTTHYMMSSCIYRIISYRSSQANSRATHRLPNQPDGTLSFHSANLNIARWGGITGSRGSARTPLSAGAALRDQRGHRQPHRALSQIPYCGFHLSHNPGHTTKSHRRLHVVRLQ